MGGSYFTRFQDRRQVPSPHPTMPSTETLAILERPWNRESREFAAFYCTLYYSSIQIGFAYHCRHQRSNIGRQIPPEHGVRVRWSSAKARVMFGGERKKNTWGCCQICKQWIITVDFQTPLFEKENLLQATVGRGYWATWWWHRSTQSTVASCVSIFQPWYRSLYSVYQTCILFPDGVGCWRTD